VGSVYGKQSMEDLNGPAGGVVPGGGLVFDRPDGFGDPGRSSQALFLAIVTGE